ncbi:MAG TPA: TetR/AcrR family transcriptional regulator [Mycobacteriales bacterium]|nr:TetR/AcrR family transcriptional regulator [Mycobacteriales bacterium]
MTVELESRAMRRAPVQRRSTERVDRMLDVCATLLHDVGYEALTTKGIAEQAGVSIGSVYQYFPDKKSIVRALAVRYLEEFQQRLAAALVGCPLNQWSELVDTLVEVHAEMVRDTAGFRALRAGPVPNPYILQPHSDNQTMLIGVVRGLFGDRVQLPEDESVARHLVIAMTIGDALLQLAYRRRLAGDPAVLAEVTPVVTSYLDEMVPLVPG